jgi:hypothetical protein
VRMPFEAAKSRICCNGSMARMKSMGLTHPSLVTETLPELPIYHGS